MELHTLNQATSSYALFQMVISVLVDQISSFKQCLNASYCESSL